MEVYGRMFYVSLVQILICCLYCFHVCTGARDQQGGLPLDRVSLSVFRCTTTQWQRIFLSCGPTSFDTPRLGFEFRGCTKLTASLRTFLRLFCLSFRSAYVVSSPLSNSL